MANPSPLLANTPVPALAAWRNNADLIAAVARLGYLKASDRVLDPTFGRGVWWKKWTPVHGELVASDIDEAKSPIGAAIDFTDPVALASLGLFHVVAFDPPYKLNGRPTPEVDGRYGVGTRIRWQDRYDLIKRGLDCLAGVIIPGGYLLLKCQDQVSCNAVRWQTIDFPNHAATIGLQLVDRLDMATRARKQPGIGEPPKNPKSKKFPKPRVQRHAHGRPSSLLVFKKAAAVRAEVVERRLSA